MKNVKLKALLHVFMFTISFVLVNACGGGKTSSGSLGSFVAIMQVDEPIEGVCDNDKVYAILPLGDNGQVKAQSPKTNEEIAQMLNAEVTFLKDNTSYSDKGMVRLIVNCKGEMVQCAIDNKTKSAELDAQIVAVFNTLKSWEAATMNGTPVDSSVLISFTIKNGTIEL
ncbi:hypothetical protein [Neptunitalea lumnitzerae]|nr:hypothetical protein [Neptunitalea sp. Y10]